MRLNRDPDRLIRLGSTRLPCGSEGSIWLWGADCLVVDEVVMVGKEEEEVMEWEVAEGREKKRNYRISVY